MKRCLILDLSDQIDKVLQNIAEGVVHPLKTRIEKIVTVSAPSTSFYAVKNLIQFYRNSIREVSAMYYEIEIITHFKAIYYYQLF